MLNINKDLISLFPLSYRDAISLSLACRHLHEYVEATWAMRLGTCYGVYVSDGAKLLYKKAMKAGIGRIYNCSYSSPRRDLMTLDHRTEASVFTTLTGECWLLANGTTLKLPVTNATDALLSLHRTSIGIAVLDSNNVCKLLYFDRETLTLMGEQTIRATKLIYYVDYSHPVILNERRCVEGVKGFDSRTPTVRDLYMSCFSPTFVTEGDTPLKCVHYVYTDTTSISTGKAYILPECVETSTTLTFPTSEVADICTHRGNLIVLCRDGTLRDYFAERDIDTKVIWMRSSYDSNSGLAYITSPL